MPDHEFEIVRHGAIGGRIVPLDDGPTGPVPLGLAAAGAATGVGSMPGTDSAEAAALIAGELSDLPHLVELPQRGAGADMIGRAMAICVDMPVEVVPSGWRLTRRPGRDLRRARDYLAWDLDAAEQHFAGAARIKVQTAGPWTLAAQVELPSGNRAVLDEGAVNDLAGSLAEGLHQHLAGLRRRLPGADLVVQIDEPELPAVLAGTLATASGFGTVPAIDALRVQGVLGDLLARIGEAPTIAHCCHPDIPIPLLREAGFDGVSLDLASLGTSAEHLDPLGEAIEAGLVLLAGLVPTVEPDGFDFHRAAEPLLQLWHQLGLTASRLDQVVVTPTCGLAGASPAWARRALSMARDAAKLIHERAQQG